MSPRHQGTQDEAPKEMPPEAVKEYMEIMDTLWEPTPLALGQLGGHPEEDRFKGLQENEGTYPDPEVMFYIDNLCSQEDFVTKAEAIIHPRFLEELLSPDPQLDLTALSKELEKEEGLTAGQHHLLPLDFAQSEASAEDLHCPGAGNPCRAPKPLSTHGTDLSSPPQCAAMSMKRALQGSTAPAKQQLFLRPGLGASAGQAQTLGSVEHSQAQKRKCDHFDTRRKKKHQ
ncbi:NUT family member 2D-like isoform X2 [Oryctolagus cuniculus]|uniref:NUT family member 2D-like isoform X2 n=1 Tax=Oryctolagus cuniculus TaxID=9986 RepID=UPI003879D741